MSLSSTTRNELDTHEDANSDRLDKEFRNVSWRILSPSPAPPLSLVSCYRAGEAAWNMALDESLFNSVVSNAAPPTLRLYQWAQPAVTIGRFQDENRTLNTSFCQQENLPFVRRSTGGRGILHGDDLTISVTASLETLGLREPVPIISIYERIAQSFLIALQSLGIEAVMGDCARDRRLGSHGDCFAAISRADVVEQRTGCKLLGAALHRRGSYLLLQASIRLWTQDASESYCLLAKGAFHGLTAVRPQTIPEAGLDAFQLSAALVAGVMTVLNQEGKYGDIYPQEQEAALQMLKQQSVSPENG